MISALVFVFASAAQAAVVYENAFSGTEAGPDPVGATVLPAAVKLPAADNPWVSGRIFQYWSGGNTGAVKSGTYAGWFKVPSVGSERELFRIVGDASQANVKSYGVSLFVRSDGKIGLRKVGDSDQASSLAVSANTWFHVAVAFPEPTSSNWWTDGIKIYIDGAAATVGLWNDLIPTSCAELWIGSAGLSVARVLVDDTTYDAAQVAQAMALPSALIWNGASGSAVWDTSAANWLRDSAPAAFAHGDIVVFPEGVSAKDVVVGEDVRPDRMTVSGEGYTFTGAGAIQATALAATLSAAFTAPVQAEKITAAEGTVQTIATLGALPGATVKAGYLKLTFTASDTAGHAAVGELMLFNGTTPVAWPAGSTVALTPGNANGNNSSLNEAPAALIDGYYGQSSDTTPTTNGRYEWNKLWINNTTPARFSDGLVAAIVTIPGGVAFNGYRLCSADGRNATAWQLHASTDGITWTLLDAATLAGPVVPNTWGGDSAKADSFAPPAPPSARIAPALIAGPGSFTIGTLAGSALLQEAATLTLTGDNSTLAGNLIVRNGIADLGTQATTPGKIQIDPAGTAQFTATAVPTLTHLSGGGTLEVVMNADGKVTLGTGNYFTGTLRQLAATSHDTTQYPKIRFKGSALSDKAVIEVMPGAQLWMENAQTRTIRIAGEGGAFAEAWGGALRLQGETAPTTLGGQLEVMADATLTGKSIDTLASAITVAQSAQTAPTLSLGIAKAVNAAIDGNLTVAGTLSGRADLPLNLWVNGHTLTFKGGTGANMGTLTVRHRSDNTGATPAAVGAILTGDTPQTYTFANVEIGNGKSDKIETLTIGANATLAVTGTLAAAESDSAVTLANGGTLANVGGTIEGSLTLQAGSTLAFSAPMKILSVGTLTLPSGGTVALDIAPEALADQVKVYLIQTAAAPQGGPLSSAFTGIPEKWRIARDAAGIFLDKRAGVLITLY